MDGLDPIPVGPKSRLILEEAGLTTIGELRELGVEEAFRRCKAVQPRITLNFLWGLEAAASGVDWREIPAWRRDELRAALRDVLA